jgi:hypothetical protein
MNARSSAKGENVFPRYDFNGDGKITDWRQAGPFKVDPATPPMSFPGFGFLPPPGLLRVVTVLLWTGKARGIWSGVDEEDPFPDPPQSGFLNWTDVRFGEDRKVVIPQDTGGF